MDETRLSKIEAILKLVDESITREEFVAATEAVAKKVAALKESTDKKAEQLAEAVATAVQTLEQKAAALEQMTDAKVTAAIASIKNGENGKDGRDGRDGIDGLSPDPEAIAKAAANLIKLPEYRAPIMDGPEEIRDKLDLLEDTEQTKAIVDLRKDVEELKRRPIGRGGGTSAMGVAQAFKYIAHTEEPTGAIDGANTTYTVKNTIWWIAGFTLNGEQIAELPNFTYSGKTITFATAIPAAYNGKDFEVKYIGT